MLSPEVENVIAQSVKLLEGGVMAVKCDVEMNTLTHPVVVDNLVISNVKENDEGFTFWLSWRPIGITERFESGAFSVEEPEFLKIVDFESEKDRLKFYYQNPDGEKRVLCLIPLMEEYQQEWEEWNQFKLENRDFFADLDLETPGVMQGFE